MEEKWYIHRNGREIVTDFYLVLILTQRLTRCCFMTGIHCILELFYFQYKQHSNVYDISSRRLMT